MKTVFEIIEGRYEFDRVTEMRDREISNADLVEKYFESDRANEEIIATYNTIDEAREAMKAYKGGGHVNYDRYTANVNGYIYFISETQYDDDGEFLQAESHNAYTGFIPAFVAYGGGQSRSGENGVNYMLATMADGTELYAEVEPVDDNDVSTYEPLEAMIQDQAREYGITPDRLEFDE